MKIVYDTKLHRPACVLLQAAMGGDHMVVGQTFDARLWLLTPTPDMALYEVTRDQPLQLATMSSVKNPPPPEGDSK